MFWHIYKNRLKVLLRSKATIFWTLLFPIVLATLFSMAFSNILADEKFEIVPIAVVENNMEQVAPQFDQVLDQLSKKGKNQLFKIQYVSQGEAKKLLEQKKIKGYLTFHEKIQVVVNSRGIEQTILTSVVEQYEQTIRVLGHLSQVDVQILPQEIMDQLNNSISFTKDTSSKNIDIIASYFYALIGMVCLYGGFFGVNAVNDTEANLSKKGARISVGPVHKFTLLIASLLAGFTIHYLEIVILFLYLNLGLHISFGSQTGYILLLALFGSLAGISFGTLIGSISKKSEDTKVGIMICVTMIFSFFAGLMVGDMKYIIAHHVPILGYINPVTMITDGLYALYYYDTLNRYWFNLGSLIIFNVLVLALSYYFLRRKAYDSIS